MSIKKEVITNSEVYTIYSSERQERMKVYFKLHKGKHPLTHPSTPISKNPKNSKILTLSRIRCLYGRMPKIRFGISERMRRQLQQNLR